MTQKTLLIITYVLYKHKMTNPPPDMSDHSCYICSEQPAVALFSNFSPVLLLAPNLGQSGLYLGGTKFVLGCVSASIFLKIHTSKFPRMRYKNCKFGLNRSTAKGNLLISNVTLTVSLSPFEGMSWSVLHCLFHTCARNSLVW